MTQNNTYFLLYGAPYKSNISSWQPPRYCSEFIFLQMKTGCQLVPKMFSVTFLSGSLQHNNFLSILFYPITLEGRRGTTDEFAIIPFHLDLFSAALVELAKSTPVHSLYPRFEKMGIYWFASVRPSLPSFRPSSVRPLFGENFSSDFSTTMQARMLIFGYLVCRLMATYCIVGLRTSLLLLICPFICPIFFPSIL